MRRPVKIGNDPRWEIQNLVTFVLSRKDPLARADESFDEWFGRHPVKGMVVLTPVAVVILAILIWLCWLIF